MREKIDCFVSSQISDELDALATNLNGNKMVHKVHRVAISALCSSDVIHEIASKAESDYVLLFLKQTSLEINYLALDRLCQVACDSNAALVYSDYHSKKNGVVEAHPVIDYQEGSVRNDFDFGSILLIRTSLLKEYKRSFEYKYAALYDLRLFLSRKGKIFHLKEYLYTECEEDMRSSGQKQFDYVNPAVQEVQKEMEDVCTAHLEEINAIVDTSKYKNLDFDEYSFPIEASVIIPVKNREKTICDAVRSALGQECDFQFNVIVVDNHSTDRTTELLDKMVKSQHISNGAMQKLVHIIPEENNLGIGGCWNKAINSECCGRFAVQLDSDDLYSTPYTLQTIVDTFYEQKTAMVIGSYRICDFDLETLPLGLIDHREWTDDNGPNNALRINGLGAPRAFYTGLVREIHFPNTSYGEDYAMGLVLSRNYRIGRIYKELYLCRRWEGNSDASLTIAQQNANNLYKDSLRTLEISARRQMQHSVIVDAVETSLQRFFWAQLEKWEAVRFRYDDLKQVKIKELHSNEYTMMVQFNPARLVSTGAKIDAKSIAGRSCFLCAKNRPQPQQVRSFDDNFDILVNPFPILPQHFTIVYAKHKPQEILKHYSELYRFIEQYPEVMAFYNGPESGASAPDHMHLQAGTQNIIPLQKQWQMLSRNIETLFEDDSNNYLGLIKDYPCPAFVISSTSEVQDHQMFEQLYRVMPIVSNSQEPMMNIIHWRKDSVHLSIIIPRGKHRPECYYAKGKGRLMISPGALDMSGMFITPREEDFEKLTSEQAMAIVRECGITDTMKNEILKKLMAKNDDEQELGYDLEIDEPNVTVGIMKRDKIRFCINEPYFAKGEEIIGEQEIEFADGAILWDGNEYTRLSFVPSSIDASFSLYDVTIGKNFHWQHQEKLTFNGTLHFIVEANNIIAINELPVEQYLMSVISSEMNPSASMEFLKASAVISRSWLLSQMEKRKNHGNNSNDFFAFEKSEGEFIKWYDREDHVLFDVCADDHCQRYQGITCDDPNRELYKKVHRAVLETRGQILLSGGAICDARFSKCCGGISEEYQFCWENNPHNYLTAVRDSIQIDANALVPSLPNLTQEEEAEKWIRSSQDAFCNTADDEILSQVLTDFDRETKNFYRWKVEYTSKDLSELINRKTNDDFGTITDLIPIARGKSGRIWKLKIVGTKKIMIIGKELEIRRVLSNSHLYSSAFVVDKTPNGFLLSGAGWGHGVGMCQIGAAVMGEKGYDYETILLHYYNGAEVKRIYK